jgi:hypothetical protein
MTARAQLRSERRLRHTRAAQCQVID